MLLLGVLVLVLIILLASGVVAAATTSQSSGKNLSSDSKPGTKNLTSNTKTQAVNSNSLPQKYDLRTTGKLTPIKDQGDLGTCWIFATYGSLESCLLPAKCNNFSENNIKNLCSYLYTEGFDRNWTYIESKKYNGGGGYPMSTAYLTRYSGPVNAASDPYNTKSGYSPSGLNPVYLVQETLIIPGRLNPLDNNQIKSAIMKYGAVDSSMRGDNTEFDKYFNEKYASYYYPGSRDPRKNNADHDICIVGWDDNYDKNKFTIKPPGNGAFIIRNSWGTDFGDKGYFYISYYDRVLAKETSVVFMNAVSTTTYKSQYSYDPYGFVDTVGLGKKETVWFANVFNAKSSSEKLSAVSFYALAPNSAYEIYVYLDPKNGKPSSGTLAQTVKGTISTMGYKTIKLRNTVPLIKDHKFSVVVKITSPGVEEPIAIEYPQPKYCSQARALAGQSYVSEFGSVWVDLTTVLANANVCLKAFTV